MSMFMQTVRLVGYKHDLVELLLVESSAVSFPHSALSHLAAATKEALVTVPSHSLEGYLGI